VLAVGAVALWLLQWFRQAGGFPTLWAEDGVLYLQAAVTHGAVENVTTPAAGYLIVLPRILAQIVVLFPLSQAPIVVAICGATLTTLIALWVYYATGQWLDSELLRGVLALSMVVLPLDIGGGELFGTILDLQWPLLFALFWTLILIPRRSIDTVAAIGLAAITGLTAGLVVVLLPLAVVVGFAQRRSLTRALPAIIVMAGSGVQILVHLIRPHEQVIDGPHTTSIVGWVDVLTVRMLGQAFLGAHLTSRLWVDLRGWTDLVCLIPIAFIIGIGARVATPRGRWLITASLLTAVVFAVIPLAVRAGLADAMRPQIINGQPFFAGARYMYCPMLLTLTAAVTAADALRSRGVLAGYVAVAAASLAILVVAAVAFRLPSIREGVPAWKGQLATARHDCAGSGAVITIAPDPAWKIVIPCGRLK
jgi:hypothetical protein